MCNFTFYIALAELTNCTAPAAKSFPVTLIVTVCRAPEASAFMLVLNSFEFQVSSGLLPFPRI